jgi:hypothetical protein
VNCALYSPGVPASLLCPASERAESLFRPHFGYGVTDSIVPLSLVEIRLLEDVWLRSTRVRTLDPDGRLDPERSVCLVADRELSLGETGSDICTADYGEFLAIREAIPLKIMDAGTASGTSLAFPSQTLYVRQNPGLDTLKSRVAERQGRARQRPGREAGGHAPATRPP